MEGNLSEEHKVLFDLTALEPVHSKLLLYLAATSWLFTKVSCPIHYLPVTYYRPSCQRFHKNLTLPLQPFPLQEHLQHGNVV